MSDTAMLARRVRSVAWGYFLIYISFKLNGWDILFDFLGWYLIAKAIAELKREQSGLGLLEGFAVGLGLWAFVSWLPFEWEGFLAEIIGIVGLVMQLVRLYFNFQLFTELARIALRYQGEGKDHAAALLRARTVVTVLEAALILTTALPLGEELLALLAIPMVFAILGFCLYLMAQLFSLSNTLYKT